MSCNYRTLQRCGTAESSDFCKDLGSVQLLAQDDKTNLRGEHDVVVTQSHGICDGFSGQCKHV
jgi:hypothetical protein